MSPVRQVCGRVARRDLPTEVGDHLGVWVEQRLLLEALQQGRNVLARSLEVDLGGVRENLGEVLGAAGAVEELPERGAAGVEGEDAAALGIEEDGFPGLGNVLLLDVGTSTGEAHGVESSQEQSELVALLQTLPDPELSARTWRRLRRPRVVLALAARHGVGGVVLAAAAQSDPALRAEFALAQVAGRARHAWLSRSLEGVEAILADAEVATASLKGPRLASKLYADPGLRPSHDLDVLIARADLARASEALVAADFYAPQSSATRAYATSHHHHLHFLRCESPLIELHFAAFTGFGVTLPSEALLARARPGGASAEAAGRRLEAEDEFLYLSLHAAGHLFARLGWLYDLALYGAQADLRWDLLLERARGLHAERVLWTTLWRLRQTLGVTVPDHVLQSLSHVALTPAQQTLARVLIEAEGRGASSGAHATARRLAFQALCTQGTGRQLRFCLHHARRIGRRRARRWLPGLTPAPWAG